MKSELLPWGSMHVLRDCSDDAELSRTLIGYPFLCVFSSSQKLIIFNGNLMRCLIFHTFKFFYIP